MKKISIFSALFLLFGMTSYSQDEAATETKKENANKSLLGYFIVNESKPEKNTYEGGYIIDNQTCQMSSAKTLEMVIQHRFGSMTNGVSDLWGIFGAANTRLGLNYSITDWLQVGAGTTKNYKLQDFALKANLLQQSKDKKVPVTVTYYGNMAIDARDEKYFGTNYEFSNRFTYFNELLVSRKFCKWFSTSIGASLTHFNKVDSLYEHDKIALHFLGRITFSSQSSIIINCDLPLQVESIKEWEKFTDPPKYNFGIGYEVATATHTFQVFAGSGTYMVPQYNVMINEYEFFKGKENIFIGFNITRMWNF